MANLYGVANPVIFPIYAATIGSVDVACPAGSETNIIDSGAMVAISSGFYYPMVYVNVFYSLGATAPTSCLFGFRIGAGSDWQTFGNNNLQLVANATLQLSLLSSGFISQTAWFAPGSHVFVSCTPAGQAVTVRSYGSYAEFFLMRAPDQ